MRQIDSFQILRKVLPKLPIHLLEFNFIKCLNRIVNKKKYTHKQRKKMEN